MQDWREIESRIVRASDATELLAHREAVREAHAAAAPSGAAEACEIVNRLHDAIIRTSLQIAEQRARTSWTDAPPVSSFAVLLFGSGGRKEQTLWSDQDNGLVYRLADGADRGDAERYMETMGLSFRTALEAAGYPPCEGHVLVSNPEWRRSVESWRRALNDWFDRPEFEAVRQLLIFSDARAVYGDAGLADALRAELAAGIAAARDMMLPRMLQNTLRHKVLVGLLGNLLTEPYGEDAGGIDMKYGAYLPMVNAVRLLALANDVWAASTLERIRSLEGSSAIDSGTAGDWEAAFRTILKLRAMTPLRVADGNYTTGGILPSSLLTKDVRRELKDALRVGAELQRKVKRMFGAGGMR